MHLGKTDVWNCENFFGIPIANTTNRVEVANSVTT